jgi:hypothetical protein
MPVVRLLIAAGSLAALAGCHPSCTGPDGGCGATTDCQQGQVCVGVQCSPEPCLPIVIQGTGTGICGFCQDSRGAPCQSGSDCPPGFGCLDSVNCSGTTCFETLGLQDGGSTQIDIPSTDAGASPTGTCQPLP